MERWKATEGREEQNLRDNEAMSFARTFDETALFRICFVCTGNICRSPAAEGASVEICVDVLDRILKPPVVAMKLATSALMLMFS